MEIKESRDELKPSVVTTGGFIARAPRKRSLSDFVALATATCGVGYMPIAPGTWGSAVGVGIFLLLREATKSWFAMNINGGWRSSADSRQFVFNTLLLVIAFIVTLVGIWAATRVERMQGSKDPGKVVIDEVAGQLITFLFIPFVSPLWVIATGFFLFRAFDIWKPYPIRRLEALESGLGIMADDVLAGLYAATVLSVISLFVLL